jgi:hypothetical protein
MNIRKIKRKTNNKVPQSLPNQEINNNIKE